MYSYFTVQRKVPLVKTIFHLAPEDGRGYVWLSEAKLSEIKKTTQNSFFTLLINLIFKFYELVLNCLCESKLNLI